MGNQTGLTSEFAAYLAADTHVIRHVPGDGRRRVRRTPEQRQALLQHIAEMSAERVEPAPRRYNAERWFQDRAGLGLSTEAAWSTVSADERKKVDGWDAVSVLVLAGLPGRGKTVLARLCAARATEYHEPMFVHARNMVGMVHRCVAAPGPLILDDLGSEMDRKEVVADALGRIVEARSARPTIITTNVSITNTYGGRVASRCGDAMLVRLMGPDRRISGDG